MTSNDRILELLGQYPSEARAWRGWKPKRNGTLRPIAKPNQELYKWLQAANEVLCSCYSQWPPFMHGGIKKRSYVSYASDHVGKACVITIDIRRCFDSISTEQVATSLEQHLGLDKKTAMKLAGRLCFKNMVAQGFATSNFVCNLYLLVSLTKINTSLIKKGLNFTNYVDDLAISGNISDPAEVINQVALYLSRSGFAINKEQNKIRIMPASHRQIICGLLVNRRLTLTKVKKMELFSSVARGTMNSTSAAGWVANLKNVDPVFRKKFYAFSVKKGLLK